MSRDLELLPGPPADPNFMPAALPVEIAIVLPKHLLHFAYFRSLPLPAASIIARIPTCVNPVDEEHKGVSEMVTPGAFTTSRARGQCSQLRQLLSGGHPQGETLQLTKPKQHHGVVLQVRVVEPDFLGMAT